MESEWKKEFIKAFEMSERERICTEAMASIPDPMEFRKAAEGLFKASVDLQTQNIGKEVFGHSEFSDAIFRLSKATGVKS